MIEIPMGKAVTAADRDAEALECRDCCLFGDLQCFEKLACRSAHRTDGKNVIFKLIDINPDAGGEE